MYSERSACLGSELHTFYCLCFQDSQDFAGRIERMLRLSMGVDLEAMVEPEEEEAEEKEARSMQSFDNARETHVHSVMT